MQLRTDWGAVLRGLEHVLSLCHVKLVPLHPIAANRLCLCAQTTCARRPNPTTACAPLCARTTADHHQPGAERHGHYTHPLPPLLHADE